MPVVSAANQPYLGYSPEGVERAQQAFVPTGFQTERATPEAFGEQVGRAVSGLGQTIGQASNEFAATTIAKQQLQNQINSDDANNKFQEDMTNILYTGPDALFSKRGSDFLNSYQGVMQQLEAKRAEYANSLNLPTRIEFNRESRYYMSHELRTIGARADEAQKQYGFDTNKAGADLALRGAGASGEDDEAFQRYTQSLMDKRLADLGLKGELSPDSINDALASSRADAATMRIRGLAGSNPVKAKQVLDENQDVLKGDRYDQLSKEIEGHANRQEDDAAAAAIWSKITGQPTPGGTVPRAGRGRTPTPPDAAGRVSYWNPGDPIPTGTGGGHDVPIAERFAYYRQAAEKRGINPDAVLGIAAGEGMSRYVGDQGTSFGDFQLHVGGGLGDDAAKTIDLQDATTWKQQADFALDRMAEHKNDPGWILNQWHGAPLWAAQQMSGGKGAVSGTAKPVDIIDRTGEAGFGSRFGQLEPVKGIIVHHTAGRGDVDSVINTFQQRGFPAQYVVDRSGKIYQTLPDGARGQHIMTGSGAGAGLSNANTLGIEVIANDDKDVLPRQVAATEGLIRQLSQKYDLDPTKQVYGHGEVNPGHKEPSEGMTIVNAVREGGASGGSSAPVIPAGAGGGGGPQVTPIPPGTGQPAAAPAAQPHFPTREELLSQIPEGLTPERYNSLYSKLNQLYTHQMQVTSADRARLTQDIKGGLEMLQDGRDYQWDENAIRRLIPGAEESQRVIDELQDAKAVGQQVQGVRGMSMGEILQQSAANEAILLRSTGDEYAKQKRLSLAFDKAAAAHVKALSADPAAYVGATNPQIETLRQAIDPKDPKSFETYATALVGEEKRLGVSDEGTHVLAAPTAIDTVRKVMADPENAPAMMKGMQQAYGDAWPAVYRDLVTLGKMPASYQAISMLSDERDASLLARGLAEQGKNNKSWEDILGTKFVHDTENDTRTDPDIAKLTASLNRSGADVGQITGLLGAIDTLTFARKFYDQDDSAASHAKAAFMSQYEFMPQGGARVPATKYDAVKANAAVTLQGIDASKVVVPKAFSTGKAGAPTEDDFLRTLKATPTWITSPKADALWLMDPQGRLVRGTDGNPVAVPFDKPAPAEAPAEPVLQPSPF